MATLTRDSTVALALSQVGVAESPPGSNNVLYSRWYGIGPSPWCAQFLSWVLDQAGNTSGYRFASTASSVAWARRVARLIPITDAKAGDVMVRLYTTTTGHTGMATGRPSGGHMRTAEGNTSSASDRDGGSVMHRDRSLLWWHYCIRLDYPANSPRPPQGDDVPLSPDEAADLKALKNYAADDQTKLGRIIELLEQLVAKP